MQETRDKARTPLGLARLALVGALITAAGTGLGASRALGQDETRILIGYYPKQGVQKREGVSLRPNTTQPVYVQVQSPSDEKMVVKLFQVRAGAAPAPVATAELGEVTAGVAKLVTRWNLVSSAASGKAAAPTPAGLDLGGPPFKLRLEVWGEKATKPAASQDVSVSIMQPHQYVSVSDIEFRSDRTGKSNRLLVSLQVNEKTFAGPPCPVSLDLRADRIPGLIDEKTRGTYKRSLRRGGPEVQLRAENLKFKEAPPRSGLVYVTVDDYERAFVFDTNFARRGQASTPDQVTDPGLRLVAPRYSLPVGKFRVALEVDNPPNPDAPLRVGLDSDKEGEAQEVLGHRQQRVRLLTPAQDGGLLFQTEVRPWSVELNSAELFGKFTLQGQMEGEAGEPLEAKETVVFTGTRPADVELTVDLKSDPKAPDKPLRLLRGAPVPLRARARGDESEITKVVFFAGKLPPDKKNDKDVLADLLKVEAAPKEENPKDEGKVYVASALLPVPTDVKGRAEVGVRFTNAVGLSETKTIVIELVDPPAANARQASIEGTVREGDRVQPNLPVVLRDPQGAARDTVRTDSAGKYVFKDVAPGAYRVTAAKPGGGARGETAVQVQQGQQKTGVDVKLTR
jgi:hypothetical protein